MKKGEKKDFSISSLASFALIAFLVGCSSLPRSAARRDFNFQAIHSVEVRAKDGIAPIISRELLLNGLSPISRGEKTSNADAILKVAVAKESPERRYIVKTTKRKVSQQTTTSQAGGATTSTAVQFEEDPSHPPIEVSGSQPYTQSVWGTADSQLIATYAQVALSGELISPKNGEVLWAGSYSYEGVDLESAAEGAIRGLIQEIPIGSNH